MRPVSGTARPCGVRHALRVGFFVAVALTLSHAASAQNAPAAAAERIVENPPKLELVRKATRSLLQSAMPRAATPSADEGALDLNVVYTTGKIWNPASQRFDTVKLRSYQGARVDPKAPFVSPLLEINPGDTIRINLNNKLPNDDTCAGHGDDVNDPHCFNGTNLHTHGLWINPAGNSDNVLISIDPGVSFQYEYNVPSDHPAGTFWYHTHRHGSTALQVSSGMAGALIIRGKRQPTLDATGDLDVLLKPTPAQPFRERVLMMQQIQYACRDADNNVKYLDPVNKKGYKCDPDDVGGIEGYDIFSRRGWSNSGRYTTINGHVLPTFAGAATGHIERWRVIHGGVRDTINLQFRKLKAAAPSFAALTAEQQDAFVGDSCTGDPLPQYLVASDGLTAQAALRSTETIFQPGYRWDILMVFPADGVYCVIDAAAPPAASVGQAAPSRQLLGVVRVAKGKTVPADIGAYLATELANAAATNIVGSAELRSKVMTDLKSGLRLERFVPHPTVQYAELTRDPKTGQPKKQTLVFDMPDTGGFLIDNAAFDPKVINRTLTLNDVEEWELSSAAQGHPFHIHVNPFQVVKILDPDGKDVSGPDAIDDYAKKFDPSALPDPQYRGMKGLWKDTIWVKNAAVPDAKRAIYKVFVRTRYQRYIGDFVLHCHILDHEDQGMMQLVRVALPDGKGGVAKGHHH